MSAQCTSSNYLNGWLWLSMYKLLFNFWHAAACVIKVEKIFGDIIIFMHVMNLFTNNLEAKLSFNSRPSIKIPAGMVLCILSFVKAMHEKLGSRHKVSLSAHYVVQLASRTRTFNCTAAQKLVGYSPVVSLDVRFSSMFFRCLS